jgi:Zn-dependent peptidase ImmA (M78 family)
MALVALQTIADEFGVSVEAADSARFRLYTRLILSSRTREDSTYLVKQPDDTIDERGAAMVRALLLEAVRSALETMP